MQPFQNNPVNRPKDPVPMCFAPFVSNTLQFKESLCLTSGAVSYNEKHNLIICPDAFTLQFYDANTFLPSRLETIKKGQIYSYVTEMSFWPEKDTFLLVGSSGRIYYYNLATRILIELQKNIVKEIQKIIFLTEKYYAFSVKNSSKLYLGNLKNGDLQHFTLGRGALLCLENLPKKNLLFSTLENGSVIIHRTDRLPKLQTLYSRRDYQVKCEIQAQNVKVNGKDFVVTAGSDCRIRIWHWSKGKIKLLKVVFTGERIYRFVYLSLEKMIVATHDTNYISFCSLPFGKLEYQLDVNMEHCQGIFLMEDKNALGITRVAKPREGIKGFSKDALKPRVKIVQLYSHLQKQKQRLFYIEDRF